MDSQSNLLKFMPIVQNLRPSSIREAIADRKSSLSRWVGRIDRQEHRSSRVGVVALTGCISRLELRLTFWRLQAARDSYIYERHRCTRGTRDYAHKAAREQSERVRGGNELHLLNSRGEDDDDDTDDDDTDDDDDAGFTCV